MKSATLLSLVFLSALVAAGCERHLPQKKKLGKEAPASEKTDKGSEGQPAPRFFPAQPGE